jgi:hypothetical protein
MVSRHRERIVIASAVALAVTGTLALSAGGTAAGTPTTHEHHAAPVDDATTHEHTPEQAPATTKRSFHDAMRRLWEDHVTWTRLFIVSFASDLPDLSATTNRLLENQVNIGDAIKPFYGDAAGQRLTTLLTEHITTAADVLAAAKAGDDDAFSTAHDEWYRNGRQIARFLSEANPEQWPLNEMRTMMRDHLDLTLAEAAHHLAGDYEQDVQAYDAVHAEILHMADMLSRGLIRQFPGAFA